MVMPVARRMCFGCPNARKCVLAASFVQLLLLPLAHAAVLDVPHDPAYTNPMSMSMSLRDSNAGCIYDLLSVDVESPIHAPLRAETRHGRSPSFKDEVFIGRAVAVTNVSLPMAGKKNN
jgi:hypothetical protein